MSMDDRNRRARINAALVLAGLPAIAMSAVLMSMAGAGASLIAQQLALGLIAATVCGIVYWRGWSMPLFAQMVAVALLLIALCIPFVTSSSSGPTRWISLPGFRLYAASLALPALIFILSTTLAGSAKYWPVSFVAAIAAALLLAAQPDASQVTAFSVALAVVVVHTPVRVVEKVVLAIVVAACNWYAWSQPDPLQPVAYVEGVLGVAGAAGAGVLILAVAVIALPVGVLVWRARALRSAGLLAVASYYVAIGVCAQQQLTPMPLLGFGAGPILGYYLFCALSASAETDAANDTPAPSSEG